MRTKLDREGLALIGARLGGELRTLSFAVNRGESGGSVASDACLGSLAPLRALEELQLHLHGGSSGPLWWFNQHLLGTGAGTRTTTRNDEAAEGGGGGDAATAATTARFNNGLSNEGIAGLLALPALKRVFLGTDLLAGPGGDNDTDTDGDGDGNCGGGGGGGAAERRLSLVSSSGSVSSSSSSLFIVDDEEFEQKEEDRHWSLAEWVQEHRRAGAQRLARGLRQRARDDDRGSAPWPQ